MKGSAQKFFFMPSLSEGVGEQGNHQDKIGRRNLLLINKNWPDQTLFYLSDCPDKTLYWAPDSHHEVRHGEVHQVVVHCGPGSYRV